MRLRAPNFEVDAAALQNRDDIAEIATVGPRRSIRPVDLPLGIEADPNLADDFRERLFHLEPQEVLGDFGNHARFRCFDGNFVEALRGRLELLARGNVSQLRGSGGGAEHFLDLVLEHFLLFSERIQLRAHLIAERGETLDGVGRLAHDILARVRARARGNELALLDAGEHRCDGVETVEKGLSVSCRHFS